MTSPFRVNNPFNTFMLLVYGLLLKLPWLISPQVPVIQKSDGFLFKYLLSYIKPALDGFPITYTLTTFVLLYTQALNFNRLLNNRRLIQHPNYLPGMSYLLITSCFAEWNIFSAALIINTLLIWAWAKMSTLNNNPHARATLFNVGMVTGIATFLYFPAIAFTLLIIFALVLSRPPKIAEWIIAALGIATPWYLLFAWLFLTNKLYSFQAPYIPLDYHFTHFGTERYIGIGLILFATIAGAFFVQLNLSRQVVQVRKNWGLMALYLIIAIAIPFVNDMQNFQYWILTAVPLSAFIACFFFYPTKRWITASMHWVMIAFVIYITYIKR